MGIIFRKEWVDLRDSTVKDFEQYTSMKVDSQREVRFANGSTIMFRHIEELNNIQNINLGWFLIEQAEELETDDSFFTLFGRLRRKGVRHCGGIIGNTNGHNWIWRLWKKGGLLKAVREILDKNPKAFGDIKDERDVIQLFEAQTKDNSHNLDGTFLASLELMKVEKPNLYRRFVENSWDDADTAENVIPAGWIAAATERKIGVQVDPFKILGVDVARYGDDSSVILPLSGRQMLPIQKLNGMDTMMVAGHVVRKADEVDADGIFVDVIGIGAGVQDRLVELKYPSFGVNAAEKSKTLDKRTGKPKFKNLRSEMWWRARESLDPSNPQCVALLPGNRMLEEDLGAVRYTINSAGQIEVESKEELRKKERLGRSPDDGDAYCLAVYGRHNLMYRRPSSGMATAGVFNGGSPRGVAIGDKADWM